MAILVNVSCSKDTNPETAWRIVQRGLDCLIHTPISPETIGQNTGLRDKNGKEIYEGDIVLSHHNKQSAEVRFGLFNEPNDHGDNFGNGFYFCDQDGKIDLGCALALGRNGSANKFEVIGNIYEHPDREAEAGSF